MENHRIFSKATATTGLCFTWCDLRDWWLCNWYSKHIFIFGSIYTHVRRVASMYRTYGLPSIECGSWKIVFAGRMHFSPPRARLNSDYFEMLTLYCVWVNGNWLCLNRQNTMNITNFVVNDYVQKCKWFGLFMFSYWNILLHLVTDCELGLLLDYLLFMFNIWIFRSLTCTFHCNFTATSTQTYWQ